MIPDMSDPAEFSVLAQGVFKEMHDLATVLGRANVEAHVLEPPPQMASP